MNAALRSGLMLSLLATGLPGCHRTEPAATAAASPESTSSPADSAEDNGVTLTADQMQRLGIALQTLMPTTHQRAVTGYGIVQPRATLVGALGEQSTADAAAAQSDAALQRAQQLDNTVAALSVEARQSLARQAASDNAAAQLAHQRTLATLGDLPGTAAQRDNLLQQLARGSASLVRITFPLGSLGGTLPGQLQLAALDALGGARVQSTQVWSAPADPALPGRSVFALVRGPFYEGEHLLAWAAEGAMHPGTEVPLSALLIYNGSYWCYVETDAQHFRRVAIAADLPTDSAVFVEQGVQPGQRVVSAGAALLLARETGSADDSD